MIEFLSGGFIITAQIPDIFRFENEEYAIAGVNGEIFIPEKWGIHPVGMCSANWKGYLIIYVLHDDKLVLNQLRVSLGEFNERDFTPKMGPEINGTQPEYDPLQEPNNSYEDLNLPLNFTGGILLGKDFIQELYVHMGFHPAWKYKTVYELVFQDGKLIEKRNLTEKMEEIRFKLTDKPLKPDFSKTDLQEWIQSTFRLDYDY